MQVVLDQGQAPVREHVGPLASSLVQEENEFIDAHGFREYGKWHLGVDEEEPKKIKKHYKFPLWRFQEGAPLCLAFRGEPRRTIQAL